MIVVEHLPREIVTSRRAVVWHWVLRDGRWTKPPFQARRPDLTADVSDSKTWGTFTEALRVVEAGGADGVGIVLGDEIAGVDLDGGCRDPRTGVITPAAIAIVEALDSYTEVSPSGTGLHVLVRGALPLGGRRKDDIEMYDGGRGRYFTITGAHLEGTPTTINERTAALAALHRQVFGVPRPVPRVVRSAPLEMDDAALVKRAHAARNGAKFATLWRGDVSGYRSNSQADQALCNLLAFWTAGDAIRIDQLFRRSGLWRPKWDERRGSETYGARTVATAIAGCGQTSRRGTA